MSDTVIHKAMRSVMREAIPSVNHIQYISMNRPNLKEYHWMRVGINSGAIFLQNHDFDEISPKRVNLLTTTLHKVAKYYILEKYKGNILQN